MVAQKVEPSGSTGVYQSCFDRVEGQTVFFYPAAKSKGGRPRVSDRAALTGILFVLKTGIPWEYLPAEMGCGSGISCWRRLRDWYQAGVWRRLHQVLLEELAQADRIDWDRAALDSAAVLALGAKKRARTQRIAANSARNLNFWSAPRATPSPSP